MEPLVWVNLMDVSERVLLICKGKIKSSVNQFEKIVSEDLPSIRSEPYTLEQILINLLVKATPAVYKKDSWIKFIVSAVEGRQDQISITVSDNGCGMEKQTQVKILDPLMKIDYRYPAMLSAQNLSSKKHRYCNVTKNLGPKKL